MDEIKILLKLRPDLLVVFVKDWQVNYPNLSFGEYFDNLIKECQDDASINNSV